MWTTVGHDKPINTLRRALDDGRTSHAYLFAGPPQVGKMTLAMDLARALNCSDEERPCGECSHCDRITRALHTDVRVISLDTDDSKRERRRTLISIDQVRDIQRDASLRPAEGAFKVFIIDGAESLSADASNALLKTLEEPPDQVVMILLATDAEELLPTISSRCQTLELRAVPQATVAEHLAKHHGAEKELAEEIARLSEGRIGWAIEAAANPSILEEINEKLDVIEAVVRATVDLRFDYAASFSQTTWRDRDAGRRELALWLELWRDVLLIREGLPKHVKHLAGYDATKSMAGKMTLEQIAKAIRAIRQTAEYLEYNVNPRLAIENMMLALPRP